MCSLKAVLFDLDGVLVDTAKYHFVAWQKLAEELGIPFTESDNERLKGVSRMASLDILLSLSLTDQVYPDSQKEAMAASKNDFYVSLIAAMDETEILPGVTEFLTELKEAGIKIGLGSASKNAQMILANTGLTSYFDTIVDGNDVSEAKPDPEVFLLGAKRLGLIPSECFVFEDAEAGCQAAKNAGMQAMGIGLAKNLPSADRIFSGIDAVRLSDLR